MMNLNSIAMRNSASFAMMQSSNAMMNSTRNINPYNVNFEALHQQDTFNSINMLSNQFKYQIANAMEKQSKAMIKDEMNQKKGLDIIA